jgi:hypothetical protein
MRNIAAFTMTMRQVDPSRGGYHITYSGATGIGCGCGPCSESDGIKMG